MNDASVAGPAVELLPRSATCGAPPPHGSQTRRLVAICISVVLLATALAAVGVVHVRDAAAGVDGGSSAAPTRVTESVDLAPSDEAAGRTSASTPRTESPTDAHTRPAEGPTIIVPHTFEPPDEVTPPVETADRDREPRQPEPTPVESGFVSQPTGSPLAELPDPVCLDGTEADDLAGLFGAGRPIIGGDYQRAYPLLTGRVLWLFQDAFLSTSHGPELVHNAGLLQSGNCFQLLHNGSADSPRPYLFPELTDRFDRWFWPLGGQTGDDGNLHVFVAEFRERGSRYLQHSEPVATWLVTIDPVDMTVIQQQPAPDPSPRLFGWSVVSYGEHTYLYAHCYRQFGWDPFPFADPPFRAHDWGCAANVTVGRIPRGQFSTAPEYWNGTTWTREPANAVPVFPTDDRPVNPVQVAVLDGRFIAVTKIGDWWGDTILLDVATAPQGPWRTYETVTVEPRCDVCNTYFASIVPYDADHQSFLIGRSNNTWGGHDLDHYHPTFQRVRAPAAGNPEAKSRNERRSILEPSSTRRPI